MLVGDQLDAMAPVWWAKDVPFPIPQPLIVCAPEERTALSDSYNRAYVWMYYANQMVLRIRKTMQGDPLKARCMWMWGFPAEPVSVYTGGHPYPWYWFGNWQRPGAMTSFLNTVGTRTKQLVDDFWDPPVIVCSDQVGRLGQHLDQVESINIPKEAILGVLKGMFEDYGCPTNPQMNPYTYGNVIAYCRDSAAIAPQVILHEMGHRYPVPYLRHFYQGKELGKYCEEMYGAPEHTPPSSAKSFSRYLATECPRLSVWNTDSFANFAQHVGQAVLSGGLRDWGQDCQLGITL